VLTECAWAAARSRDSYLAAQFWRLARRIGKKKAAIAVAHSILVIAWHLPATLGYQVILRPPRRMTGILPSGWGRVPVPRATAR
jgi:hypothetical protein